MKFKVLEFLRKYNKHRYKTLLLKYYGYNRLLKIKHKINCDYLSKRYLIFLKECIKNNN